MPRAATSLNTWAIALARELERRGIPALEVFALGGIGPDVLATPNGRHSVDAMRRVWSEAVARSGDPCIGLHTAQFVQPTTFVTLGLAILASDTLEDAMRRGARFSRVVTDAVDLQIDDEPEGLRQTVRTREGATLAPQAIDLYLASTLKMGRLLTGMQLTPARIWRTIEPSPAVRRLYRDYFDGPIHFGAEHDAFLVPHAIARRPLPMANPALALANDSAVRAYLASIHDAELSARVREAVITRFSSGEPQRSVIARGMHLGEKTLQRRLAEEGTTFQKLVDETRDELARRYVADSTIPLAEVAFRLGFAEQSGFTRAFKRWTGRSPSAFRDKPAPRRAAS